MYIRERENKLKDIPIHQINLQSKIISDTVNIGVVDELLMWGIDPLIGNDLSGNKEPRPNQNNQEAHRKTKFRLKDENKMKTATGPAMHAKAKQWEKENSEKRKSKKLGKEMQKNSKGMKDLIRNQREDTELEEYYRIVENGNEDKSFSNIHMKRTPYEEMEIMRKTRKRKLDKV